MAESPNDSNFCKNNKRHWLDYAAVWAASFAALAASAAAGVGAWQAWIARDSEQRQLRAYIYVLPSITDFSVGKKPYASITIKNGGQTPAYDFNVSMNEDIRPFPQRESLKGIGTQPSALTQTSDGIGAFLYQSHEYVVSMPPVNALSRQDYDDVIKGTERRFYVWGRVLYLDAFKRQHHLNFCFTIDGDSLSAGTTHYCKDYNDTDH